MHSNCIFASCIISALMFMHLAMCSCTLYYGGCLFLAGQPIVYPRNDLTYTENILHMMFSLPTERYEVDPVLSKALEVILILHMDHEQNASTSTVRVAGMPLILLICNCQLLQTIWPFCTVCWPTGFDISLILTWLTEWLIICKTFSTSDNMNTH